MPSLAETQYGRISFEEAGHPRLDVQVGETANVVKRFGEKIRYYNQVLNVHLTVESNPRVQDIAISDGVIQVNPLTAGSIKNKDFLLLHEAAHDKQRALLGFTTTETLINSFTQDLTTTELGARDWIEKYTMPPFVISPKDQPIIFGYYSGELRTSLARGIRDIHSDVIALRNRKNIYLTDQEKKDGMDPEQKFLSQFRDELTANIPWYGYHLVQDTEPDFIRKIARFKAVVAGAVQYFKDDYYLIGERYDAYIRTVFGEASSQYQIYTALSKAYQAYFLNCTQRTELIDPEQMITALDSPNMLLRARAADFLGEMNDFRTVEPLMEQYHLEKDSYVSDLLLEALVNLVKNNLEKDISWKVILMLVDFPENDLHTVAELLAYIPENRIPQALEVLNNLSDKVFPPEVYSGDNISERDVPWEETWRHDVMIKVCAALAAIGKMQPYAVVELLKAIAKNFWWDESDSARRGPASTLVAIGKEKLEEVLDICDNLISSENYDYIDLAVTTITTLSQIGVDLPVETLSLLKRIYQGTENTSLLTKTATAARIIGKVRPAEVQAFFDSLPNTPDVGGKGFFFHALQIILGENLPPKIVSLYQEKMEFDQWYNPGLKEHILATLVKLGRISGNDAVRLLTKYRSSKLDYLVKEPYELIGSVASDLSLEILKRLSRSQYPEIRAVVVSGLVEFGLKRPKEALIILDGMLMDVSPIVLVNLAGSIGRLARQRADKVLEFLQHLYIDPSTEVKLSVAISLVDLAPYYPAKVMAMSERILREVQSNPDDEADTFLYDDDEEQVDKIGYIAQALSALAFYNPREVLRLILEIRPKSQRSIKQAIDAVGEVGKFLPDEVLPILMEAVMNGSFNGHYSSVADVHAARALLKFISPVDLNQILIHSAVPARVRDIFREHLVMYPQSSNKGQTTIVMTE